jgi:hypothetical protein
MPVPGELLFLAGILSILVPVEFLDRTPFHHSHPLDGDHLTPAHGDLRFSFDSKIYRCTSCRSVHFVPKIRLENEAGESEPSLLATAGFASSM